MTPTLTRQAPPPVIANRRARRFSPRRYHELTSDNTRMIGIKGIRTMLGGEVYTEQAVLVWRRRTEEEGGYGPVALPAPNLLVNRGQGIAPIPLWYLGAFIRWACQTGRLNLITYVGQQPRRTGRGRTLVNR